MSDDRLFRALRRLAEQAERDELAAYATADPHRERRAGEANAALAEMRRGLDSEDNGVKGET